MTASARPNRKSSWLRRVARTLYLLVVQSLVGVIALVLYLYLALNSPSAAGVVSRLLSSVLPGELQVRALHVGPSPGRVALGGVEIWAPGGRKVLGVRGVKADLAWARLVDSLLRGPDELVLRFDSVWLRGADVRIEFDERGRLLLPQAFTDPEVPPSPEPGRQIRLNIEDLDGDDIAFMLDIPAVQIRANNAKLKGSVHVNTRQDEMPDVGWQLRGVRIAEGNVQPAAMADLPRLPTATIVADQVDGSLDRILVRGLDIAMPTSATWTDLALPDTALNGADLAVQLTPEVEVEGSHVHLAASTQSSFLGPLLGKNFDARALLDGSFTVDQRGFRTEARIAGGGLLAGFQLARVDGRIVVEAGAPGDDFVRVVTTDVVAQGYGGRIDAPRLTYRMKASAGGGEPTHLVHGRFVLDQLSPSGVLTSAAVAMQGAVPLAMQGALSGQLGAAVRVRLDPAQDPPIDVDVALDTNLTMVRRGLTVPLAGEVPRLQIRGGVVYGAGPGRGPVLDLDEVVVHTGPPHEGVPVGHEWLSASGHLDVAAGESDLRVAASIPHLARLLEPLGVPGIDGSVELSQTRVRGSLAAPQLLGDLRARHITAQGHEIRTLRTKVRLKGGLLTLEHLEANTDLAMVRGDVELRIAKPDGSSAPRLARVRNLQVSQLDLGVVLPGFGVKDVTGMAGLDRGSVTLDLADVKKSLRFEGDVYGRGLTVFGEVFPELSAHVAMHGGAVRIRDGKVGMWTGATAVVFGEFHLASQRFALSLDLPSTDLATIRAVQAKNLPVRGSLAARIEASGDRRGVAVEAKLVATDLGWDKIELGSADLFVEKTHDGPATFKSDRFFPHFRLLPGTEASFSGQKPQQIVLHVATDGHIDPFALLSIDKPVGMSVQLEVDTVTTLDLRPGQPLFTVQARFEPGGIDVDVGGLQRIRNVSPVEVKVTPTAVDFGSMFFEIGRDQLELCGRFVLADAVAATPASILLFLAGTIDVPRVGPLAQSLAALDLRLDLQTDPHVAADTRAACLVSGSGKGRMRVEGPLDSLRIDGVVKTRAGHVAPRRFGHDIAIAEGGEVHIEAVGRDMTITIPRSPTFSGTFDDGRWTVWGTARLRDGAPRSVDLHLIGSEIPWSAPKEYAVTANPNLQFVGTQLDNADARSMVLSGSVDIHDGAFYKSFDKLGGVFGAAADRQVESFNKPLKETMPWLAELQLDLGVHASEFEFTSRFPLLRFDLVTELDLRVGGTIFDPRVFDRVNVKDGSGSQIHYAINHIDFDVVRGALDFHGDPTRPYMDLVVKADIPVRTANVGSRSQMGLGADLQSETSGQLNDVVVITVTASGVLGDPNFKLGFSSNQGDSDADVQYIIATGHRRTESTGAAPQIGTAALLGSTGNEAVQSLRKLAGDLFGFSVVDTFVIDYDPTSTATIAEATKKLGKQVTLAAKVLTGREEQRYSATFAFRFNDRFSFNGLWRRQQLTVGGLQEQPVDIYDFKLRYRKPLE